MTIIYGFIAGITIGVFVGIIITSLCVINHDSERCIGDIMGEDE